MKPWMASTAYFWEEAPFFRLLLPLVLAVLCYELKLLPAVSTGLLGAGTATGILIVLIIIIRTPGRRMPLSAAAMLHCCLVLIAWLVCCTNDIRNDKSWFGHHRDAAGFAATVSDAPAGRERTWKLTVDVYQAYGQGKPVAVTGSALVYIYKDGKALQLSAGDTVLLPPGWLAIRNAGNPHEFDYATHCRRNGLYYQQFLSRSAITVLPNARPQHSLLQRVHQEAAEALACFIKDSTTLGLMQAMLLGDAIHFDPELRQYYAETGIIHIVAISGSHVMVLFQLISLLFFWTRQPRYRFIKYLVAVPLVCFYVAVAGAPVSAVRAAAMFTLLSLGSVLQKDRQPLNQLFATAFCMLLYEPMWLFAIGFQLSFIAVLSLMLFYRPVYRLLPQGHLVMRRLMQAVAASIAAEILVAPLVIYYFHLFPVSFLIANVVAYVFMGVVLTGGLLVILFAGVPALAGITGSWVVLMTGAFNKIVYLLQQMNPEALKHLRLSLPQLVLVYLIIAGIAASLLRKERKGLLWAAAAGCLFMAFIIGQQWTMLHQREFVAYNINRSSRIELIEGKSYSQVLSRAPSGIPNAVREHHIQMGAWNEGKGAGRSIMHVGGQSIAVLDSIKGLDTLPAPYVDYLVLLDLPTAANARQLKDQFPCGKLVISGDHRRSILSQWRDSCKKHHIPVHFTLFDGAFVVRETRFK